MRAGSPRPCGNIPGLGYQLASFRSLRTVIDPAPQVINDRYLFLILLCHRLTVIGRVAVSIRPIHFGHTLTIRDGYSRPLVKPARLPSLSDIGLFRQVGRAVSLSTAVVRGDTKSVRNKRGPALCAGLR